MSRAKMVLFRSSMSDIFKLPPATLLAKLLIPIALGFMMLMCIDFSDVLIARLISEEAQAVLGYSYALIYFMIAIGFGLNQGLTITGSEAYVNHGTKALYRYFYHTALIAFGVAIVLILATLGLMYFQWFDAEIMAYYHLLKPYLSVILSIVFPTFLLLLVCAVCQIKGRPEVIRDTLLLMLVLTIFSHPLIALEAGNITIFGIDILLPVGLGLGLTGIAISKGIVTLIGLSYAAIKIFERNSWQVFKAPLEPIIMKSVAKQAFPAALIQLLVPAYLIMLTKVVTGFGVSVLAGFSLGYRVIMVIVVPILGVLVALMVVITHDLVSKQFDRVKQTLRLVLTWGSLITFLILLGSYFVAESLLDEGGLLERVALQYLRLGVYITVLEYVIGVCTVSFQSVKKPLLAFLVQSFRTIIYPAPILYYLSGTLIDIQDLWYWLAGSFSLATVSCLVVSYYYFWRVYLNSAKAI